MAANLEDDYIDMEVTSFTNLFEFQMSHLCPLEIDKTTFPADELFYKGKLLPLHLPPRLLMHTFIATGTFTTPVTSNTPFESCTVSPADSCQVSKEPNPKDYFLEYSSSVEEDEKKKSWSKKLRLNTRLSFGKKIKSSRAYLRSFFGKSRFLKRSTSTNSEIENSIQGAILHCKQSQQQKQYTVNEVEFCSLSASRIAVADDRERAQMFRG
ncbi:hypothetical protein BRARA_J01308 [Brassica rapa]|uniref:Membrane-associated kinase regulator 4 n=1 Tax=Brassica campestris TaxID=3711 RepID=A0A397XT16_BRACM|nr:hypothetical protein BRARA_J01308 [Brassica rapa]